MKNHIQGLGCRGALGVLALAHSSVGCGESLCDPDEVEMFNVRLDIAEAPLPADLEITLGIEDTMQSLGLAEIEAGTVPCSLKSAGRVVCRWGTPRDGSDPVVGRFVATAVGRVTVDEQLKWKDVEGHCLNGSYFIFELRSE